MISMEDKETVISVMVICANQEIVLKVSEVLHRACAGLALEGLSVSMNFTPMIQETENENETN